MYVFSRVQSPLKYKIICAVVVLKLAIISTEGAGPLPWNLPCCTAMVNCALM